MCFLSFFFTCMIQYWVYTSDVSFGLFQNLVRSEVQNFKAMLSENCPKRLGVRNLSHFQNPFSKSKIHFLLSSILHVAKQNSRCLFCTAGMPELLLKVKNKNKNKNVRWPDRKLSKNFLADRPKSKSDSDYFRTSKNLDSDLHL